VVQVRTVSNLVRDQSRVVPNKAVGQVEQAGACDMSSKLLDNAQAVGSTVLSVSTLRAEMLSD
jgi:hypothetical protein